MSLLLWYRSLDRAANNTLADSSGQGLDSVLSANASTLWSPQSFGGSENYGGSKRAKTAYSAAIYPGNAFTLAWWMNLATATGYASNAYIIGQFDYAANKRQWAIGINSGASPLYRVYVSSDGSSTNLANHSLGVVPTTGSQHIAVTCNNVTKAWALYINGALAGSATATYSYQDLGSFLTIGGLDASNYVNAAIGDVRIYNTILAAHEIKSFCAGGRASGQPYPWQFQRGQHGTMMGALAT